MILFLTLFHWIQSSYDTYTLCREYYTVKKVSDFPVYSWDVTYPNSPWPGVIKLFLARESLVSDIPAGDVKIANLFYSVSLYILFARCV